ncbi:MAG: hypothetical protein KHX40_11075, partial [Oscillospiraceae bacterium]|nr:hypothetical protein [Oscillospiraceae bacterium]
GTRRSRDAHCAYKRFRAAKTLAEAEFTSAEHEKSTGPRRARKQYMEKYQMIRYDAGEYDIAVIGAGH